MRQATANGIDDPGPVTRECNTSERHPQMAFHPQGNRLLGVRRSRSAMLEHMFDEARRQAGIAHIEELFRRSAERLAQRSPTPESKDWLDQISTAVRIENQAVAAQLSAIGALFRYRLSQCGETEDWA